VQSSLLFLVAYINRNCIAYISIWSLYCQRWHL